MILFARGRPQPFVDAIRRLPYCGCVESDWIVAHYSQDLSKHPMVLFDRCCGATSMLKRPIGKIGDATRERF
jgi:hypothetical protein